jgi:hypothetical protein
LEQVFASRLTEVRRLARRRQLRLGSAAVLSLVVVLGGLILGIVQLQRQARVRQAVADLEHQFERQDWTAARQLRDQLQGQDPRTAQHPDLAGLWARLDAEERSERNRKRAFEEALRELAAAPLDDQEQQRFAAAAKLAHSAEEQTALTDLQRRRQEQAWQAQREREEAFLPRLRALQEQVQRLERLRSDSEEAARVQEQIATLAPAITELVRDGTGINDRCRTWAQELAQRAADLQKSLERREQETRLVNQLTRALTPPAKLNAYVATLATYVKEFPDTARSQDAQRALQEQASWGAALEWKQLLARWASQPLEIGVADAPELADNCRAFLRHHERFFAYGQAQEYLQCVEAITQRRESDPSSAAARLRGLFSVVTVRDLWLVKVENGKTYYSKKDLGPTVERTRANTPDGYVNLRYLVNAEGKERATLVKVSAIEKTQRAPQSVLADHVAELPANFGERQWEQTCMALAHKIKADAEIDPILRVSLLAGVLEQASKGSVPLARAVKDVRTKIQKIGLPSAAAWMDPSNDSVSELRSKAQDLLKQLPSLEGEARAALANQRDLERAIARTALTPVGWLVRDKGTWSCRVSGLGGGNQELCVLQVRSDQETVCERIGTLTTGTPRLDLGKSEYLLEGRIVFARLAP